MKETLNDEMEVRRVTLADGRYLVFYTFDGKDVDHDLEKTRYRETENESSRDVDRGSRV
jgi:hypothetical protein